MVLKEGFICKKHESIFFRISVFSLLLLILFPLAIVNTGNAIPFSRVHDNLTNITYDILINECRNCHLKDMINPETGIENQGLDDNFTSLVNNVRTFENNNLSANNYTILLEVGQTPYQLGSFLRWNGWTGYSWWDTADYLGEFSFGTEIQKNLISLMILENGSGSARTLKNLVTPPTFPQVTRRNHSLNHSYKADTNDPRITIRYDQTGRNVVYAENNYENNVDLWMIKYINLTGYNNALLAFWTWYSVETDWDYAYVMVSNDSGNTWVHLNGTHTTSANPNGKNLGNGITGTSSGWIRENMDLTAFAGKKIILAFRFISDPGNTGEGWYIDDINITSNSASIYFDDAETPVAIKTLSVNVSYPQLTLLNKTDPLGVSTILQYNEHTQKINLTEDIRHPGIYSGYFLYKTNNEFYSGNYSVTFNETINNTRLNASRSFQTTLLGCNNCHNKQTDINGVNFETSFIHDEYGGGEFCAFTCHSGSRGFYGQQNYQGTLNLRANPMHVHEMKFGHIGGFPSYYPPLTTSYNVPAHVQDARCIQCHTNFLHDNNNTDTAVIAGYVLYGTNITFSSGTHENLTCEYCHGTLDYPLIPENQFRLNSILGEYKPDFTSHEAFTDTYIIAVNGTKSLNLTITGENTNNQVSLYTIGPVDNTSRGLMGPCAGGGPCEIIQNLANPLYLNISNPYIGTWIAKIFQKQEGEINYTISSNYPIQKKPVIKIPECSSCHNPDGSGKVFTKYKIPNWNPGFAHADTNSDGTLDVQCRMCHDSMHDIGTKKCHDCHSIAPSGHPVSEPSFSQYDSTRCLDCHGDPHNVTSAGGTDCVACHFPKDVNITKYDLHANVNRSDGPGNVTNADCWTCHYQKDMDKNHIHYCEACHAASFEKGSGE